MLITSIALLSASLSAVASIDLDYPQISSQDGGLEIIFDEATIAALSAANDTQPAWKCDVRVWTRAPDLSPGKVFPADARLAANGSACGDIVQWNVGMRLKERAIIKKRFGHTVCGAMSGAYGQSERRRVPPETNPACMERVLLLPPRSRLQRCLEVRHVLLAAPGPGGKRVRGGDGDILWVLRMKEADRAGAANGR